MRYEAFNTFSSQDLGETRRTQYYWPKHDNVMFTDILYANSQTVNTESKCFLSGGIKTTTVIWNKMTLFFHSKDSFYHLGSVVCTKDTKQIFSYINERYFGWSNLTDQSKHYITDFSIIKYSLESSNSRNYRCMKIKNWIFDVLLTRVDLIVPKIAVFDRV